MSPAVMADDKDAAETFIRCRLCAVMSVLQNKDLNKEEKSSRIAEIVKPMFDFSRMAKLTLGKRYWPGLSKETQKKFTHDFTKLLEESYRNKLLSYTDEKIVYEAPLQVKKKVKIPTYLVSESSKTSIIYKLYKPRKSWKIYDIEIQGVSIIQTYRSQFTQILQSGTVDDLLLKLEELVDS
jgi:phospholipid transport system substrate-binding protein